MNVLYMIKIKLPNSAGYHSSPSGDTEYEDAYDKAINESLPEGWEIVKPKIGVSFPRDSQGFSYLHILPKLDNMENYIVRELEHKNKQEEKVKSLVKQLYNLLNIDDGRETPYD